MPHKRHDFRLQRRLQQHPATSSLHKLPMWVEITTNLPAARTTSLEGLARAREAGRAALPSGAALATLNGWARIVTQPAESLIWVAACISERRGASDFAGCGFQATP